MTSGTPPMQLTGERTLPGIPHENYWFRRHEVVYRWAARQILGRPRPCRTVLDAGSGEGYGADLLRRTTSAHLTAVDYDADVAAHVRRTYPRVPVVRGNLVSLPFAAASFDALVSLQTIEHLWNQRTFVAECVRVTRPRGLVILSTPNRLTFPPGNICHARELTASELRALLPPPGLHLCRMTALRHGPRISQWERRHGSVVDAQLAATADEWPDELKVFIASLTDDDFLIDDGITDGSVLDDGGLDDEGPESALDLLVVAEVGGIAGVGGAAEVRA